MLHASDVRTPLPLGHAGTRYLGHADAPYLGHADVPYLGHADTPYLGHADVEINLSIASGGRETGRTPKSEGVAAPYSYSC